MSPKSGLTSSFSVSDASNEVVCPLKNQDGSNCRKRCFGEKRYRSMQEHIRRAHPDYYIPKLPATEESFVLMVNTPLSERPQPPPSAANTSPGYDGNYYNQGISPPQATRPSHDYRRGSLLPAASAAAALAQLHNSRPEPDWDTDQNVFEPDHDAAYLHNYFANPDAQDMFDDGHHIQDNSQHTSRDLLTSNLERTPSIRAASLQPFPRSKPNRPRKSSITEHALKPKHERNKSREHKRLSHDRKAFSAEPSGAAARGGRWEDLLDAAASATEEESRDLTPIPGSARSSMPPSQGLNQGNYHSYNTSPLQNAVMPHSPDEPPPNFDGSPIDAFPSVESSYDTHGQHQPPYHHHQSSNESATSNPYSSFQHSQQHPPPPSQQQQSQQQSYPSPTYSRPPPPQQSHHASHPSGSNFHMPPEGLSSSPQDHATSNNSRPVSSHHNYQYHHPSHHHHHHHHQHSSASTASTTNPAPPPPMHHLGHTQAASPPAVQHYCAACHRIAALTSSYACTECVCGICRDCVDVLVGMGPERGARCPRCHTIGAKFKPFMLDLR